MNQDMIYLILLIAYSVLSTGFAAYKQYVALSPAQKQDAVKSVARSVVAAVEQQCAQMDGPSKKKEAVRVASQLLNEMHIPVSPVLLDTLLEQAVLFLSNPSADPSATQAGIPAVKIQ
jgi:hypothetical protein